MQNPNEVRLSTLAGGTKAVVSRVSEVAEREAPLLLGYLHERDLVPGRSLEVLEVDSVGRTVKLRSGEREITLSHETGAKLWVVPS